MLRDSKTAHRRLPMKSFHRKTPMSSFRSSQHLSSFCKEGVLNTRIVQHDHNSGILVSVLARTLVRMWNLKTGCNQRGMSLHDNMLDISWKLNNHAAWKLQLSIRTSIRFRRPTNKSQEMTSGVQTTQDVIDSVALRHINPSRVKLYELSLHYLVAAAFTCLIYNYS